MRVQAQLCDVENLMAWPVGGITMEEKVKRAVYRPCFEHIKRQQRELKKRVGLF